jgi:sugar transferase (PEP-CTERM/EpsH1 system associated)
MAHILVLTPQLPFPPHQGTTIRNFNLVRGLAARHQVDLLSLHQATDPPVSATPLTGICRRVEAVPAPPARTVSQRLRSTLGSRLPDMALRLAGADRFAAQLLAWVTDTPYDVIQVEGIEMAPYLLRLQDEVAWRSGRVAGRRVVIFDDHNAEYRLQQRVAQTDARQPRRWPGAAYSFVQWQKLRAYEAHVCRQADQVVTVSRRDAAALQALVPALAVTVVPNGVDLQTYAPGVVEPLAELPAAALVFTGKMDYRPNVDAVLWFAHEVLPLVRSQLPHAHLVVVGQQPHPRLAELHSRPDVTLTGRVPDVRPYLAAAGVCVLPFRMGSGTRLKALEAMAMGKAIVSTSLGIEGIDVVDGQEMLIADDARAFAAAVVRLLLDEPLRSSLGVRAQAHAVAHYSWDQLIPRLEALFPASAAPPGPPHQATPGPTP